MAIKHSDAEHGGHNRLEWAKVRKRMVLGSVMDADWEGCNTEQRYALHQIELAIKSVTVEDLSTLEE